MALMTGYVLCSQKGGVLDTFALKPHSLDLVRSLAAAAAKVRRRSRVRAREL